MKRLICFLFFISSFNCLMDIAGQKEEVILNGFKQFLGEIYSYRYEFVLGGLSNNTQYLYHVNDNKYLVRILGESFLKRKNEIDIHCWAGHTGISPRLYYYDDEYSFMIMDFVEGHTLLFNEGSRQEVLDDLVKKVQLISNFGVIREDEWNLCNHIKTDYIKLKDRQNLIISPMVEEVFQKIKIVEQELYQAQWPLVFCHNDLHSRNIFFTGKEVVIIDWEMAGMNYEFYDLARYSVFLCLDEVGDCYILSKYLERSPSINDLYYFKCVKLMMRAGMAFYLLVFLENISTFISMESIKDYKWYLFSFAQDAHITSAEFLYGMAISQLQLFIDECNALKRY